MREIKFRFWGDFGIIDNDDEEERKTMLYGDVFAFDEYEPINDLFKMRDTVVMQYTGLKDSKGVDIYEGDLVKYYQPYAKRWDTHIVKYDDGWACFGLFEDGNKWCKESDWGKIKDIEIIGNIWEVSK